MDYKLNVKQKAFADEYIKTLNARESYKKYYKPKSDVVADSNASQLLRNCKVKKYIDDRMAQVDKERIASAEEVLQYLTSVMRGETQEETVVVESTGNGYSEARIVKKVPSEKDRIKAGELLGKRYRLFTEKVEIEGEGKIVIVNDIPKE